MIESFPLTDPGTHDLMRRLRVIRAKVQLVATRLGMPLSASPLSGAERPGANEGAPPAAEGRWLVDQAVATAAAEPRGFSF
jgi:hypothetical protein